MRRALAARFCLDLPGLLNALRRADLEAVAVARGVPTAGGAGELRARLWHRGAIAEAGGSELIGTGIQPRPALLAGKLVHLAEGRGRFPPAPALPRPVPAPRRSPRPPDEPRDLEGLLRRADLLVGVRLGRLARDKGALGSRAAALLGVRERGWPEPDWKGEVEIKVVPVVRDRAGAWRVAEDPAVGMEGPPPMAKLGRVLWLARVADERESPILSWYYQELDERVRALAEACLHTRPKGAAGASTRGWYLHKRFFTESGLLRSLNG